MDGRHRKVVELLLEVAGRRKARELLHLQKAAELGRAGARHARTQRLPAHGGGAVARVAGSRALPSGTDRAGRLRSCGALWLGEASHRDPGPWTIGCDDFQRQIDWLQDHFEIVDLQECQRRIRSGFNKRPTVAITFDDGYSDNCDFALPMLIERRIPVTYFVTTKHTLHQQAFEHDLKIQKHLGSSNTNKMVSYEYISNKKRT